VLVCLVSAEETASFFAAAAAGVAGCSAVDRCRVIVSFFLVNYLALAVGLLNCEDGVGGSVGTLEGIDDADSVADGLSLRTFVRVGLATGCAHQFLLWAGSSLDRLVSANLA
jgi:hypothetical protein